MLQIVFNKISAAEVSSIPTLEQLDLLGDFQVSESTLQTLDDARFGKMEKDGYVERSASPDDRRVMLVWLTDKGKAVELPDQKMPEIIFGKLNQGAQNQLCMYFEQMISSLQNELGEEGDAAKEAREQRNEFFESAKQAHAEQTTQASQPAAQTQPSAAPRPAPAAPPVGSPLVPPIPPVSTPPRIG